MGASHDWAELLAYDRDHVWHPYAPLPASPPPLPVVSASGVRLRLADGRELVDAMASWWTAIWGYRHPVLDAALRRQAGQRVPRHVRRAHPRPRHPARPPAGRHGARRAWTTSSSPTRGPSRSRSPSRPASSTSATRAGRERSRFLALAGGYHGDTFGAMAVCDPVGGMHHLFGRRPAPPPLRPPPPRPARGSTPAGRRTSATWPGATATKWPPSSPSPSSRGRGACGSTTPATCGRCARSPTSTRLLLLLDEIATGFGRTGRSVRRRGGRRGPRCHVRGKGTDAAAT